MQREEICKTIQKDTFAYDFKNRKVKNVDLAKKNMQDLINKIENGEDLTNQDLKKLKFANKGAKDSASQYDKCKHKI